MLIRFTLIGFLLFSQVFTAYSQWLTGYQYRKSVTIPAGQVTGGPHTNFPVLISVTDPDLRTQANGGLVQNANGWDIIFSQDNVVPLSHQVESYDATIGQLIAWVNLPSLPVGGTVFYMYFGNGSVVANPSTPATWVGYLGVWHLNGNLLDATVNGNDGTNNASTTAAGKFANGRAFTGGGQNFTVPSINSLQGTASFWFRPAVTFTNASATSQPLLDKFLDDNNQFQFVLDGTDNSYTEYGAMYFKIEHSGTADRRISSRTSWTGGTWYYISGTWGNIHNLLVNAANQSSANVVRHLENTALIEIGGGHLEQTGTDNYFNGRIDEIRISSDVKSDQWVATEYQNQNSPASFTLFSSLENSIPQVFNVSGSGSYCSGSGGLTVQLSGSQVGVDYQLKKNGADQGTELSGTGGSLSWSGEAEGTYTVVATKVSSGLTAAMTGSAIIDQNPSPAAALGYQYQKTITIDHNRVSGGADLSDFPVLINISASPERDALRTVGNGGHMQNVNGYDILFTDENYNRLDCQIESYTAANGNLIAWVRVPTLSASVNTRILLLYGNPQVSVNPSVKTVWKPGYQGVWHMDDNPGGSAPQLKDAASTNDGTANGSMNAGDLVAGNIGTAINFDGSNDYFNIGTGISPAVNFTEECWLKLGNQADASYHGFIGFEPGTDEHRPPSIWIYNQNRMHGGFGDNVSWCSWQTAGQVLTNDNATWNHVVVTFDGTDYKLYVNGALVNSVSTWAGRIPYNTPIQYIGRVDNYFSGTIDELRVMSEAMSSGWITTEFNNQGSPATFYNIGSEATCSVFTFSSLCSGSAITYSVPNTAGHTYAWSVTGGTPSAPNGNSITVTWNASGPYSIMLTETSGSCSGSSINYSVAVSAQPVAQNITKLPNVTDVCVTGSVSATFSGGSGGITPTDVYESSTDGGTSWQAYVSGSPLSSAVAGANRIQIRTHRTTTGTGCNNSSYNTVTWNTVAQPVAQTITKNPNVTDVCVTGSVSATFSGGSGGVTPTDVYESSTDAGATWQVYTAGNPLSSAVAGANRIQVRTRRTSAGTGCSNSAYNTVTWNTISQPVAETITKAPNVADVCVTGSVSATFSGGSGGVTPTDVYESSVDAGSTWQSYVSGSPLSSVISGANQIQVRTRRTSAGTGCSNSAFNTVTWNTLSQPTAQTITKAPNVTDVCVTGSVSATFSGGIGGVAPTDVYESSVDAGATWQAYVSGSPLSSAIAATNQIQVRTRRTSAGTGCSNSAYNTVTWNTIAQPVAQTITKSPNVSDVCISGSVSATFSGGSGGVAPADVYESSVDAGATWQAYTSGSPLSSAVAGANRIRIRTRRTSAGTGCSNSAYNTVTWNTISQPVAQTITKSPNVSDVCVSGSVSATFSGGSGGVAPADVYESSVDAGATWQAYTSGSPLNSATAGSNQIQIRTYRTSSGTGCSNSAYNTVTWNTLAQPVAQTITKLPDIPDICVTGTVSATFSGGTGGVAPADIYESSIDAGATWQVYIPGSSLSSAIAGINQIQVRTRRTSAGTGCSNSTYTTVTWNTFASPAAPVINLKSPGLAVVCEGQLVSATFIPGSGGVGCADAFQYRFDGGAWNSYTPGVDLNTTGHTLVEIQGQRAGCTAGAGCSGTAWMPLATWNVNPQPAGPTLNLKSPNLASVCEGVQVSATFNTGTGGVGCADVFQYRFDSGTWNSYSAGTNLNTTGHTLVEIQGQRSGCTAGAGCSGTPWVTLASWVIDPNPVPVISGLSDVCPGSSGITYSTPLIAGHTYVWTIVGAVSFSGDNSNVLTVNWPNTCGTGSVSVTETITATGCVVSTSAYTVTRIDLTAPTWTTAAGTLNRTLECSDAAGITAAQALFPVATDNCDADVTNIVKISGAFVAGSCPEAGTYTNTWTVTDACGNISAVYTQVITIQDTQAPTWTTAAGALNRTLECSDAAGITAAQALFPVASDNCDADVTNIVKISGAFVAGSCPEAGTYTNTWTVTDACGNISAVYTQVITIQDTQAPTWTTAAGALNRTLECSDAAGITAAQALFPVASDNCDADVTNIVKISGAFVAGSCPEAGTYTNTWTVTDACGNISAVYTQVITIQDTQAPTWTTAAGALNRTLQCSDAAGITAAQALFPVASDNCDADVTNIVKISGAFVAGSCPEAGTYTNTWTVTDACGNISAVYTQVITIQDTQAPTWTTAAGALNRTLECSDAAGITAAQALFPVATDNCDADVTNIVKISGAFVAGSCPEAGTYTNTWTVTDACGNISAVYTQVITIQDTQAPTWTTAAGALNRTLECSDAASITAAQALFPVASDNCDADVTNIVKISGAFVAGSCPEAGTYTNTWTVTDACGNISAVYTQVITIQDTQAPTWTTAAGALNRTLQCSDAAGIIAAQALFPVASDNCDADVTNIVKISGAFVAGSCPEAGTYTNSWTVTDACGNISAVYTQVITIQDTQAPIWTTAAGSLNRTLECSDATGITAAQALFPVATDNCDADVTNIVKISGAFVAGSCPEAGTYTNTWKVTDACGNISAVYTQVITIQDTQAPTWTTAAGALNRTLECSDAAGITAAQALFPVATDNCDADVTNIVKTSGAFVPAGNPREGTYTNTWVVTDACGNISSVYTQIITIVDNTPPVLTCPSDVVLNCQDDNTPAATGTATATDNCSPGASIVINYTDSSTQSADPSNVLHYNYTITRTWRATDEAGNYSECIQTITVHDITNPVITCPADVTINCQDDSTPAGTGTATATDICTPQADITITHSDVTTQSADPSNVLHYNYTITRTWRATDVAGNYSECIQTITVHDITNPVITCPADVTINCQDDSTPSGTGTATATDICTPQANITITYSDVSTQSVDASNVLHYNYTITRTWRATDVAGNYSECIQTITVHDITNPVITCPADVTINCQDDSTPAGTGTATATDTCTPQANITITYSDVSTQSADPANVLHYNYTITRTWRATDVAGNFSECIQTITVHDITNPVITCPANVTINCQADSTPAGTGTATATDICTPQANITITHSDVTTQNADPSNVLHYNYTITRTWRATDVAGNYSECIQTITIHDITNPVITCPADVTINCQDDSTPSGTGTATATDICTLQANITITYSDVSTQSIDPSNVLHYNYTITRTWRATDVAGNFSECIQTITVHDITNPVITCPADVTINCQDDSTPAGTGTATATDICTPQANITITYSDVITQSADPSNVLHYNYTITRTWRATDVAGNYSECIQTITVHDITNPVITCPADVTINCQDDSTPAGTGTATATDICTPQANITITYSDVSTQSVDPSNVLHYNYTITRTWRATDVAGNYSECIQTITVHDITNPVITCPADVMINCQDDSTPAGTGTATATDICTPQANITITYSDVSTQSVDASNVLHYNYTITRTWRATDVAGNYSECIQTITVHDITNPVITCPADVTINCQDDSTPAGTGTATATDICTPQANITITYSDVSTQSADPSNILHYNYTITRTWRATDVAGNYSECIQTITIHDITNPVITCPADVTINCQADSTPAGTGTATATDICTPQANITITSSDVSTQSADPSNVLHYNYTITRTWRATDVAGNYSECIQTITVHDITNPSFTVPADITICRSSDCSYDVSVGITGDVTDEADNCEPALLLSATFTDDLSGLIDCDNFGFIVRTWSLTDIAGNTTTKAQIIRIEPTPQVTVVNTTPVVCNGGNVDLTINSPTVSINTNDLTYIVVVTSTDPAHLGGTASTGFTKTKSELPFTLSGTLTNSSDSPIIVTYTLTPGLTGCGNGPVQTTTVTVDPTPSVIPDKLSQNLCNDATTNITLTSPSVFASGQITFDYTVVATGGVTGFTTPQTGLPKDYVISDILHNPTDAPQTVTYTITPISPRGCQAGPSKVVVITVDPTPQVIPDNQVPTLCNDGMTKIVLNSPSTFISGSITFNYTVTATGGVTGFVTPVTGLANGSVISDVLHNPTDNPQTVTYTIVPVSPAGCPSGPSKIVVITVNPTPQVIPSSMSQTICNDEITNITLGSPSTFNSGFITFNLTASATGGVTGFSSSLNGLPMDYVISDILHNPTDSPQTVTYTITPVSPGGCADGPVKTIVVTVDPTPQVEPSAFAQTVCNDGTTSIVFGSPSTFTSGVISFNYTVVATGGVTGFSTPVTGLPLNFVLSDVLHNPTNDPQTVTYTITPVSPTGCPSGPSKIVTILVEPTPQVVPSTLSQIICNNTSTNIILTSPSIFTNGVITFNYTVVATGGVTGFTTPVTGLPNGHIIADVLHNPTNVPQTVTYTVVPISPECSATDPIKIITVTVNPTPIIFPVPADRTQCDNTVTNISLQSPNTFTSGVITFKFTAVASGNPGDVTGFTPSAVNLPLNYVIADNLVNHTDQLQTVTYTIIPVSPTGCADGPSHNVIVTINPTPRIFPIPANSIQCDKTLTNIVLQSPSTFTSGVIKFKFTAVASGNPGDVTGFTPSAANLPLNYVIADNLVNHTDQPQTVTYTIVPVSPTGCADGPSQSVIVTINPTPRIFPVPPNSIQCDKTLTNIVLQSPSTFTSGVIKFKFTAVASGNPGDVTGFTPSAANLPLNYVIADNLVNHTDQPQTVTYTITPVSPTGCADGPSQNVIVTINPTPRIFPLPPNSIQCDKTLTNIVLQSPSTFTSGVIKFKFTAVASGNPGDVTGFTPSASNLPLNYVIADNLVNHTDQPQTVTYTITPVSPTGCADGPSQTVIVTINPTPRIFPVPPNSIQCDKTLTNILLQSPSTFTSGVIKFKFTAVASGNPGDVTGFTPSAANLPLNYVIADNLVNHTDQPQTVTYTIVPVSPTGCADGPSQNVIVTINPTPRIFPVPPNSIQCDKTLTNIVLQSPSTFTSGVIKFKFTAVASGNTGDVTGFTPSAVNLPLNYVIADNLVNHTDQPQTVTYTIVPVSPTGCADGQSQTVIVTINPTPRIFPVPANSIQCDKTLTNIVLQSPSTFTNGVIKFKFTAVASGNPGDVTGFTLSAANLPLNYVIADNLVNHTDQPQTVTYTIVPVSPTGCSDGPSQTVIVTINPTPRIFPLPVSSIQCDSTTTNVRLQSPSIFTSGLVTFNYSVTTTGSITGFSTPLTGLPNNHIITDDLINSSDHFQSVIYHIIPASPTGCADGPTVNDTVKVNPTPRATPDNNYPSICYAGTKNAPVNTEVILKSPTVMTSGQMVFDYTVSTTGGAGVVVGNTTPGFNQPQNSILSLTYQNNSDTIQSVYYSIIPKVSNSICVPGRTVTKEVKVHARPLQSVILAKQLTCLSGSGLATLVATTSKGAAPYSVVWDGPVSYHKTDSLEIRNLSSGKYVIKVTDNLGCNRKDSISIVPVTARPYISADPIPPGNYNISCIGSTDGTILVSVTGGITPPYNYWVIRNDVDTLFTGIFTNNFNPLDPTTFRYYNNLAAGSYTLMIRDVNQCESLNRIVFRVPPPMTAVFTKSVKTGGYNISCKGYNDGSVRATVSGGRGWYKYRWYTINGLIPGPVNTNQIDNLIAGTYYLEIKDTLNCIQVLSTVITEPTGMQLTGSQVSHSPDGNFNISCNGGNDGSISIDVSGGSGNYNFLWSNGATTKNITGLRAGDYTCTVKDQNGCVLTPSPTFHLTEPNALMIAPPVLSHSTDGAFNINCFGANTGSINITVTGGSVGNYTYTWSTPDGSGLVNGQKDQAGLTAGNYHLAVTDANGCSAASDIVLTQPTGLISTHIVTHITCASPGFNNGSIHLSVSGGVTPYSYLWSNGSVTQDITGLTYGNYTVTITDFNGCTRTDSATIDLPPPLNYNKTVSNYNGYNISCNLMGNGFINITPTSGEAPFVYTWTGPNGYSASTNNISNLKAGQYHLLIVDNNECKNSETIDIKEPGKLGMTVDLSESTSGGFNINCAGDSTGYIYITPVNQVISVDYLWADGIFGKTRTNLPAGTYEIIITDANNCHASESITLSQPDSLRLAFKTTPPFCPDKPDGEITTNVTGGVKGSEYSYRWSDNSTNPALSNIPAGFYELKVTDLNGCVVKDSVQVEAVNETCLVIPNAISPNGDLINDVWNIGLKELYPLMEVKIFNRWGQPIWRSEKGYPRPWDGTSNGASLPIDSYHYIIDLHNGSRPIIGNVTIVK